MTEKQKQKQRQYWNSRIQDVFDKNYNEKFLKQTYKNAYNEIEAEIEKIYERAVITSQFNTTQLYRYDRFIHLLKDIKKQQKDIAPTLEGKITDTLSQAYSDTFNVVISMLHKDSTWSVQNDKFLKAMLQSTWCGANYSERVWDNTDKIAKDVENKIANCIVKGTSKDTYVKTIQRAYNTAFYKADRIVRTELMHAINQGQIDTYKQEGITQVEWIAEIDERTCDECEKMDRKIYNIDDMGTSVNILQHPNCRCTYCPIVRF